METYNNGGRPQTQDSAPANDGGKTRKFKASKSNLFSLKALYGVLFVGMVVLVVALIAYLITGAVKSESSYVDGKEYQAVFVNVTGSSGGQAYFGHINRINSQYIELSDVFYLEPGSANNQFTLNNLTCALYNPQDIMVINRSQVAFWENLKPNSQVTVDIKKWHADNLQCSKAQATTDKTPAATTKK